MLHNNIAVYPVSVFNQKSDSFCFIELGDLLANHPFLGQPNKYSFYMLFFIVHVEGHIVLDETSIRLDHPKSVFIKPGSVFSMNLTQVSQGWVICFTEAYFSLRYNDNILQQFSFIKNDNPPSACLNRKNMDRWLSIFELIKSEISFQQKDSDKVLRSYINILLFDLDRCVFNCERNSYFSNKERKLFQFERLIEDCYIRQKNPSFYAKQLNITSNYLNKLCKSYKGITSGELIRKRVILEAKRLLNLTSLSVSEIGYALGFDSPSYFITFFRKNTDHTPESYRKECLLTPHLV